MSSLVRFPGKSRALEEGRKVGTGGVTHPGRGAAQETQLRVRHTHGSPQHRDGPSNTTFWGAGGGRDPKQHLEPGDHHGHTTALPNTFPLPGTANQGCCRNLGPERCYRDGEDPFNHILQLLSFWWVTSSSGRVFGAFDALGFLCLGGFPPAHLIQHFVGSVLGMLQPGTNPLEIHQRADEHDEKWEGFSEMKL